MAKNREKVTIKIEGEKWQKALDKAFKQKQKTVNIDGFRKGNVPKEVYYEKFGIESLYSTAVDDVCNEAYQDALSKTKVKPVVSPVLDVKDVDKDGVTFEFSFIGKPEITLGEYKNLKIKKSVVKITDEDINKEIDNLRSEFAEIKTKDNDLLEMGDTAVIDFEGFVDKTSLEGAKGSNYPLLIGSNTFIPGFEDALIGMKVNESKDINLKFPDDYTANLAGKDVTFKVTLKEIKVRILPEIDEDFFEDLGDKNITSEETLKEEVKKVLMTNRQTENDDEYLQKVLDKAVSNMKVELDEEIIDDEVERMLVQFEEQLKMQKMTFEQYYEVTHITPESLKEKLKPSAITRIKQRFLLEEVAAKENITVTDEEALADANEMAKNYGITKDELLKAYGGMEIIKYDAQMRKTLKFLIEN